MKDKSKGFTLLEAALILLIMGMIGVAAIPSVQNIRRQEVSKLVKEIGLDLVTQRQNQHVNSTATYELSLVNKYGTVVAPFYGYKIKKDGESKPVQENITNNRDIQITIVDAKTIATPQTQKNIGGTMTNVDTSFIDATKEMPTISYTDLNTLIDGKPYIPTLKFKENKMIDGSDATKVYDALIIRVKNGPVETFIIFNYVTGNYYIYKN